MLKGINEDFLDVSGLLEPQSVAVIGASDRPGNFGGATVRHLIKFGFKGPMWPVNRTGAAVAGVEGFSSISALPETPDLAVLAVPANGLLDAIRECVARGVHFGIAYAAGLAEAGGDGRDLQRALVALCRDAKFTLCGPNCLGVINTALPATPTFATALDEIEVLPAGTISMVSQSGGIGTTAFSTGLRAGFGFRFLISSGNEAIVDFSDYLFALARDEGTRVIAGYLEGLADGPKFTRALEEAQRRGKPVVLLKAGASGAGARAALAHTGALVGEDRVFDSVLREMGVVRVYSVSELVDVASLLAGTSRGRSFGLGVGIVTFGGGNGVLAADQCALSGLRVPALSAECTERLKPLLTSVASAANPIDLTPATAFQDESLAKLPAALEVVVAEPEIDVLLFIVGTLASRAEQIVKALGRFAERSPKPLCVSWPSPPTGLIAMLAARSIYTFIEPADAVRAIGRLAVPSKVAARRGHGAGLLPRSFDWASLVTDARPNLVISEHHCHAIMRAAGLPVAAGSLATDEKSAVSIAAAAGYPVALKGISDAVTHRAAAGLVLLDRKDSEEVVTGFRRMRERAQELSVRLDGVYVQRMHGGGTELLVAAFRDPLFGTMISCGCGGILAELIDDVITERAPVDIATASRMINRLRVRRHARDRAGELSIDLPAAFVARFSELAVRAPWRRFVLEANPVKWTRDSAVAVDGLLIIDEA
jgi:acetate---CoA ligase (ADP-forming)